MLYDWVFEGTIGAKMDCDFERLDLSSRPFLEKSMELVRVFVRFAKVDTTVCMLRGDAYDLVCVIMHAYTFSYVCMHVSASSTHFYICHKICMPGIKYVLTWWACV
jgi:hypothetical protein